MNYEATTIQAMEAYHDGIRVETSTLNSTDYFNQAQHELFDVYGRIHIHQLFIEFITAQGPDLVQVLFNCTFTTPVIAANAMCAKCASIANQGQGGRIVWVGGEAATAAVITDSAGLSDVLPSAGQIVGGHEFVGTVGILGSDASASAGTFKAVICYTPLSDGAYVVAKV